MLTAATAAIKRKTEVSWVTGPPDSSPFPLHLLTPTMPPLRRHPLVSVLVLSGESHLASLSPRYVIRRDSLPFDPLPVFPAPPRSLPRPRRRPVLFVSFPSLDGGRDCGDGGGRGRAKGEAPVSRGGDGSGRSGGLLGEGRTAGVQLSERRLPRRRKPGHVQEVVQVTGVKGSKVKPSF